MLYCLMITITNMYSNTSTDLIMCTDTSYYMLKTGRITHYLFSNFTAVRIKESSHRVPFGSPAVVSPPLVKNYTVHFG